MYTLKITLIVFIFIFMITSCSENSSNEDTLQVDAIVTENATLGWELNKTVMSGNEISQLTRGQGIENEEIDVISTVNSLKKLFIEMKNDMENIFPQKMGLFKANSDSLLIYEENKQLGTRKALYYDAETGIARYYEVKYKFAAWRNIVYDSSQVTIDLNYTINDITDDQLKSLHRQQEYSQNYFVQKIVSSLTVTALDGNEITGLLATTNSYYHSDRSLSHLQQTIEILTDESGTLREDFDFRNGDQAYRLVTFNTNGTGIFEKMLRNGTIVTGTFDGAWEDLQGSYSQIIDFPDGFDVDKIMTNAIVSITLPDNVFNGNITEIVYFTSGRVDSGNVMLKIYKENDLNVAEFIITKSNGAHGLLTLREDEDESTLEGEWTTWDGYFIIANAEYYLDGSAQLHYEVFLSPQSYNNGDDPLIEADYYFSPDQVCNGTLAYQGETFNVSLDEAGKGKITRGAKSVTINSFE